MTEAAIAAEPDAHVVPGRECGGCTLCCKVYAIPEIDKPGGKWCTHCKPGRGCTIHDKLPKQCAEFNCLWRTQASLPAHWKPDQAKMVVTIHPRNGNIYVQVDPGMPSAWRRQPFYDQLREWWKNNLHKGWYVIVYVNELATLILPNQDMPLGRLTPEDVLVVRQTSEANGGRYDVTVLPRAADPAA